jgi:hypothetical protein
MSEPSRDSLTALKVGTLSRLNIDVLDLKYDKVNPLQQIVPCFELVDGTAYKFFGPYVLNLVSITGPYIKDGDPEWDQEDVDACKAILAATYSQFSRYETHVIIDIDADAASDPDYSSAMSQTRTALQNLCSELAAYGFTYVGDVSSGDMTATLDGIIRTFYNKAFTD